MSNHVSVHIDAKSAVEFHCTLGASDVSLRIEHPDERSLSSYYLMGSLAELERFADRITDEVERLRSERASEVSRSEARDIIAGRKQAESRLEAVQ